MRGFAEAVNHCPLPIRNVADVLKSHPCARKMIPE